VVSVLAQGIPLATPASEPRSPALAGFALEPLQLPPTVRPAPAPTPESFAGATCARIWQELALSPDHALCLSLGRTRDEDRPVPRPIPSSPSLQEFEASAPAISLLPSIADARPGGAPDPSEMKLSQADGLRLDARYQKLAKDSVYLASLGIVVMGTMIMLPPSVSQWNTVDRGAFVGAMPSQWSKHVSKGPVVDQDKWAINYIGHPVSGSFYYQVARNDGFGVLGSTVYSAMMSAFFWEYGIEAFAEVPSTQDLILTPLGGALLGEAMYQAGQAVIRGGGTIFGSHLLGGTALVLLNPAGSLINGIDWVLFGPPSPDAPPGRGLSARSSLVFYPIRHPEQPELNDNYFGLQLDISM
jgi:Domain of unknown function (DUF3943)